MKSNLYIPKKIHVGFQKRSDTYTGKLAYVIYEDEKGVLRKQGSWDGWRDKSIKEVVLDNEPTRFVFNKGVQRHGYFGSGRSVMRVYDNRDFEFEISIENLVGILMHSDISKRDIVEECVFAWSGKDLVLLPVNSEEYRSSVEFTDKQSLKVSTKDLVKGYLYEKKKSDGHLMYMGYEDFYDRVSYKNEHKNLGKKHIFYDMESGNFVVPTVSTLARVIVEEVHKDFATINEKLYKSYHLREMKDFNVSDKKKKDSYSSYEIFYKKIGNVILQVCVSSYYKNEVDGNNVYISKQKIEKNGKTLYLEQENIDTSIESSRNYLDKFYEELGFDWKFEKSSYYYQRRMVGSKYKLDEVKEKLKNAGFGRSLTVVDAQNNETSWTI